MKNFIVSISLIAVILLFVQCEKDNSGGGSDAVLSPPQWIIGTWAANPDITPHSYMFTSNNITDNLGDGSTINDWSKLNNYHADLGVGTKITETEKSESVYKVTLSIIVAGSTDNTVFTFEKVDGLYIKVNQSNSIGYIKYFKK